MIGSIAMPRRVHAKLTGMNDDVPGSVDPVPNLPIDRRAFICLGLWKFDELPS